MAGYRLSKRADEDFESIRNPVYYRMESAGVLIVRILRNQELKTALL